MHKADYVNRIFALFPLGAVFIVILLYVVGAYFFVYCKSSFPCGTRVESDNTHVESDDIRNQATKLRVEPKNVAPETPLMPELDQYGFLKAPVAPKEADEKFDPKKADEKNRSLLAQQYSARINWVFLMVVYSLLCLAAFAVALWSVFQTFRPWKRRFWPLLGVIGAPAALVAVVLFGAYPSIVTEHSSVIFPLLEKTVVPGYSNIVPLVMVANTVGYAAALSLVLASCAILWPSSDRGIKRLSAKVKQLKVILYAGTLLLVGSVLLMRSLFQWSLTFVSQPDQSYWKAIEGFNTSVISAEGGFYTLLLAAAFLPAFFILNRRAQACPSLPQEEKEREQILKAHDLTFSLPETSKRILTVSAPLLGGLIADLFSRVSAGS